MEQGFDLFSHWTFESFAPGSISQLKYDACPKENDAGKRAG